MRLIFGLSVLLFSSVYGQDRESASLSMYESIWDAEFDKVEEKFSELKSPSPLDYYSYSLAHVLRYTIIGDKSPEAYLEQIDTVVNCLPETDYGLFVRAEIHLHETLIHYNSGEELEALFSFRQAYITANQCKRLNPDFLPINKTLGFMHAALASVPEEYQWILSAIGWKSSMETATSEINSLMNDSFWESEALAISGLIYTHLLNNPDLALEKFEMGYRKTTSVLFKLLINLTAVKNSQPQHFLLFDGLQAENIPQLHYINAERLLQMGKYDEAQTHYKLYLQNYQGKNLIKDSYYKIYLSKFLNNDTDSLSYYLELSKNLGQSISEADKYAEKNITEGKVNRDIMRLRLATDGGYYSYAYSIFKKIDTSKLVKNEKLEILYRKARLDHKTGEISNALNSYSNVIESQKSNDYFAPNSCLMSGLIYEMIGDTLQAKTMYIKTMEYQNYPYRKSIVRKAKARLSKLED